jgi:hypothetical protein
MVSERHRSVERQEAVVYFPVLSAQEQLMMAALPSYINLFNLQVWPEPGGCRQEPHFSGEGRDNPKDSWEAPTRALLQRRARR